jgi:hypothetical protein
VKDISYIYVYVGVSHCGIVKACQFLTKKRLSRIKQNETVISQSHNLDSPVKRRDYNSFLLHKGMTN